MLLPLRPDKAERLLVSTQSQPHCPEKLSDCFLTLYYVIVLILLLMIFTHWSEYMIRTGLIGLDLFDSIDIGHFLGFAVIPFAFYVCLLRLYVLSSSPLSGQVLFKCI